MASLNTVHQRVFFSSASHNAQKDGNGTYVSLRECASFYSAEHMYSVQLHTTYVSLRECASFYSVQHMYSVHYVWSVL